MCSGLRACFNCKRQGFSIAPIGPSSGLTDHLESNWLFFVSRPAATSAASTASRSRLGDRPFSSCAWTQ